jgi:demethylspheroidene O-methyltransferase
MRAIFEALPPGGTLLLAEPMAQAAGSATGDAYFHFYLLAMGEGRLRTAAQLHGLMAEAGFVDLRQIPNPMPLHASLLTGQKPA